MNLEDTVYFGCAAYSMIHPHRAAELNHLFLVIGNGYEWENGELVEECGDTTFKNGKRRSIKSAISNVFRERKESDRRRKEHERKRRRDEKLHPEKYPKMSDSELNKIIDMIAEDTRREKEKDPVAFEEKRKREKAEHAKQRKQWREEDKWQYAIPADIKKRIAYQQTTPGAFNGYNHWYPVCEYSAILTFPENIKNDWLLGVIEVCQLVIANPPVPGRTSTPKTCAETVRLAGYARDRALSMAKKRGIEVASVGIR